MSCAVILSKKSIDVDTQSIAISFEYGSGSGSDTDTIIFTGSKTLEEIVDAINLQGATLYQCSIIEDYIRIQALTTTEILSVVITGDNLSNILGGAFTVNVADITNYAVSSTWGIARIPFMFSLKTTNKTNGGIKTRKPFIKKLTGKDYVGKNGTSSSKVIMRKGYDFTLRMDFIQIDWLADFLEFSRNDKLKIINGEDYNYIETDEWELLTENTSNVTSIYDIYNVLEINLGIIKV